MTLCTPWFRFNASFWSSMLIGGLLLWKLEPRLPSGHGQNWEARMPLSQCLGHQQEHTISSFHCCCPKQSRGDDTGNQAPRSVGRWWCYYNLPPTLESNQALLCSREAAAPHRSCHSAVGQKKKKHIYAVKFQFLPGNSNWSPTQLWLTPQYIKYCAFKLNLENKQLFAPREFKAWPRWQCCPTSRDKATSKACRSRKKWGLDHKYIGWI